MNLFFVLILLIAAAANGAEFETTINGNRTVMYYEDGIPFYPTFTMYKWGEEESLTISYSELVFDKCEIENGKYKAEGGNLELEAYGLGRDFKMEITIKSKPASNQLVFYLTGWENFDFYYQPPLTQWEIDNDFVRPENVVGSYAVYHKTKRDNQYKTGKFRHIYRIKFTDSVGTWVWATLFISNGLYVVTIPDPFLDSAVYPIRANDTFGDQNQGGSYTSCNSRVKGYLATSGAAGTGTSMSVYIEGGGSSPYHDIGTHIYVDEDNLLANGDTTVITIDDTGTKQYTLTFATGPTIDASTTYLLAVWGKPGQYTASVHYDEGGTASYDDYNSSQWNWPTSAFSSESPARLYSIFVTYTASGGGGAAPKRKSNILIMQ